MYPLFLCSLVVWGVIFDRLWRYRKMNQTLKDFHLEAVNALLQGNEASLQTLCQKNPQVPTARVLSVSLERLGARDVRQREKWREATERSRQWVNQDLRRNLWLLGTIAASAPFIGLFGTVVGILSSFGQIAQMGKGGFAVVAAGISEALIATAAGIVVAVVAVLAFNAFQTQWSRWVLTTRIHLEEMVELLESQEKEGKA